MDFPRSNTKPKNIINAKYTIINHIIYVYVYEMLNC